MIFGLEPYVDRVDEHRRFLESINPTSGFRLFIKRSVTEEESKSARNKAGTSDNWSQRSYSSLRNEAYAISFVRKHTSIPVPTVFTCFEDRGCFYLVQEYAEGCISATHAAPHLHQHIARQLAKCVQELHDIRSHKLTCFVPEIHLPARMQTTRTYLSSLTYPEDPKRRYVLCHGDLGWQNVMVDPDTGYIKAVIDWEYAGFFPVEVEGTYWQRWGIAAPIGSEISDADHITALLQTLSSTRAFPKGYKVKSFKIAMDSDQGSPLRDVTEVSPNPQSKITRLLTRIFRKKHEAKSEAASNAQPKDSTGDTQNLRLPESTQKIPTDPNLSAA
ncbi:uncharacterized protein I303_105219 [Kwoniella dejecticola CBS 10117]|uniref:Aminoglycoside phosphotransferase domain-containing protein n=1 Tax=Kwoniella dejecticola CBS 10117 TaxID=1296121 RepID=A0A1A6A345_9TREE|nr:uncharacterized protein I303_05334 [Kwoniella dejecticola CBS 10117]OBR84476.1 hypothetical protein I303_05334 [Kwoniella dejecticola CBS 10117]